MAESTIGDRLIWNDAADIEIIRTGEGKPEVGLDEGGQARSEEQIKEVIDPESLAAAGVGASSGGVMVALVPTTKDAERLALDGGEPRDELHVTLAYLGDADDLSDDQLSAIRESACQAVEAFAEREENFVQGDVAGIGNLGSEDPPATVLFLNGSELENMKDAVWNALDNDVVERQYRPWIPHMTLTYEDSRDVDKPDEPIRFDRVRFAIGEDVEDFLLGGTLVSSDEELTAAAEVPVPWHLERNHADCPSGEPWAVVKDDDDSLEGCHATREDAIAQLAALNASEDEDDGNSANTSGTTFQDEECPPDHHRMPDGSCMADSEMSGSEGDLVPFEGVATVEGTWTGDGRQFAPGSLEWPNMDEIVVPFQWQKETNHGGNHDLTVNIGRLTSLEREGNNIRVRGVIDTGSDDGAEYARRLNNETVGGVSIVADDPEQAEVEMVWPEGCDEMSLDDEVTDEDIIRCLFPSGEIYHSGRIRALTAVDIPAFVEGSVRVVETDDNEDDVVAAGNKHHLGAVASHSTETTSDPWNSARNVERLQSPMSVDTARSVYAWVDNDRIDDDDQVRKAGLKFPHHMVSVDGTPGAANLTACSSIIGILNGAQGGADIPRSDIQGVYNHVARHLRDAGKEPPPPSFAMVDAIQPLVAASHLINIPDVPPSWWFEEPSDRPPMGALSVTDEGRVYGYLAPRNVAHRSYQDKRITVPTGNVDYSRWMNRERIVEGGQRIATGAITMDCGHAATFPGYGAEPSAEHYDNSCSIVATVRVGENKYGVWVAGALLSDVEPSQVARMLACQLSGDWRPHREKPGKRELVGALLVPVPGFPLESAHSSVRLDHGELVASAVPVKWTVAGDIDGFTVEKSTADKTGNADCDDCDSNDGGDADELPDPQSVFDKVNDSTDIEGSDEVTETSESSAEPAESANAETSSDDLPSWDDIQNASLTSYVRQRADELAAELGFVDA